MPAQRLRRRKLSTLLQFQGIDSPSTPYSDQIREAMSKSSLGKKKTRTAFFCQNCGYESPKWAGKCPSCNEWNTFVEEVIDKGNADTGLEDSWIGPEVQDERGGKRGAKPTPLLEIDGGETPRWKAGDAELDRVLGGGVVPGSLVLIGGEPGIGKSTLLLQLALISGRRILYVSGEESARQVKLRSDRLLEETGRTANPELYILTETDLAKVFRQAKKLEPDLVVIDSVQTLRTELVEAAPGSVSQIRTCAGELLRYAKTTQTPVFVIGHINKDGAIAGPKVLEHMVDTVLQFEGDRNHIYRILRTIKNRFGSTAELGIYEMRSDGLRSVDNPSEWLLGQRDEPLPGIAIAATLEGQRPMMIEVQALVSPAVYGNPQRTVTGFDLRRLNMLLAVLEKRCGYPFGTQDVFLNIAGGIRVEDPAIDLAVVSALMSSYDDRPLPEDACFCGEVGLSGEIRAVGRTEQRVAEAARLGYRQIYVAKGGVKSVSAPKDVRIIASGRVDEVLLSIGR